MSNDVRPPVDPMSDLSWARVERGLWARLDGTGPTPVAVAPRRRWLWIAVPSVAVAAIVALIFASLVETPEVPRVTAPAVDETPTRIVSSDSPSMITVGDAHVTLDANSAVVHSGSTAVLERGAAWFAIAPRTDKPFVVVAGDTIVRVIGTKFRVARFEEHATVEVERGTVEVSYRGSATKVAAGELWTSKPAPVAKPEPVVIDPPKPPPAKPPKPQANDREKSYYRMAALEAKDGGKAILGYLELARGSDRWAQMSLYAAARLATDRREPRAKVLLDSYLRRFPRGANADDARKLLDRLKGAP